MLLICIKEKERRKAKKKRERERRSVFSSILNANFTIAQSFQKNYYVEKVNVSAGRREVMQITVGCFAIAEMVRSAEVTRTLTQKAYDLIMAFIEVQNKKNE